MAWAFSKHSLTLLTTYFILFYLKNKLFSICIKTQKLKCLINTSIRTVNSVLSCFGSIYSISWVYSILNKLCTPGFQLFILSSITLDGECLWTATPVFSQPFSLEPCWAERWTIRSASGHVIPGASFLWVKLPFLFNCQHCGDSSAGPNVKHFLFFTSCCSISIKYPGQVTKSRKYF